MPRDLTQGSILKNIGIFSIPYLISYFLQTLYGMADLFIVGQFGDAAGITAVSIGSQLMHFFTVILIGLAMGTTVLVSQAVGGKKLLSISRILGNTAILFCAFAAVSTAILLFFCPNIVALLSTPPEAVADTIKYLTICFIGIPFITAYNVIAATFRGLGDSKSPMYFITIACVINIALDYLFIGPLKMGASGAAFATVLSQTISVIISAIAIKRNSLGIRIRRRDFRIHRPIQANIFKIGFPIACQDGFIQVSFLVITAIANSRGLEIAAAVGIVEKIICFLFLVPSAMLSTVSALAAQNIGAKNYARAKSTLATCAMIAAGFGAICGIAFQFISEPVLALFTSDANVIRYGAQYMHGYVFDCMVAGIHFCFNGYFCACKHSLLSFIHNVISIVTIRVPGAYLASIWYPETLFPMGIATLTGSILSALICVVFFIRLEKKSK